MSNSVAYREDDEYDGDLGLQPALHHGEAPVHIDLPNHHPDIIHLNRELV